VSDDVWALLVSQGRPRRFETGDVIVTQGQAARRVVVLLDGRVKVTRSEADGTEVLLAIRDGGEIIGEISAFDGGGASATVTALRECASCVLAVESFTAFVELHRDLESSLLRLSLARRRESEQIRIELTTLPVKRRLVRTLLRLMGAIGTPVEGGIAVDLGMPQEELARAIGASRSQLAASLGSLRQRGVLGTGRRRVVIRDPEALAALDAESEG
jgi:CRP-like cAMP-binding protein